MYVNDLETVLSTKGVDAGRLKLFLLIYADDIVIVSETHSDLQQGLNILSDYCQRWKLTVNVDKTKVMIFRKGVRVPDNISFNYRNREIEIVKKFTYLGFVFTCGGSLVETYNTLSGQAIKALFKLNSIIYRYPGISVEHILNLFDKLIIPVLSYGCEVWGLNNSLAIEKVHLNFCKQVLRVRKQTMNKFIYGETGRMPIRYHTIIRVIKYWFKIINSSQDKYIKVVYNMLINDLYRHPNKRSWVTQVKFTLQAYGFNHVWIAQGVANENIFLKAFEQRIKDNYIQIWNGENDMSSRNEFYTLFSTFGFKDYLK